MLRQANFLAWNPHFIVTDQVTYANLAVTLIFLQLEALCAMHICLCKTTLFKTMQQYGKNCKLTM